MKKLYAAILTIVLCLSLAACGSAQLPAQTTASTTEATVPTDHYQILYDYVTKIGYYDAENDAYYIQKQGAANKWFYLVADDGGLRYLEKASDEADASTITLSYECTFYKDKAPTFRFEYGDFEMADGVSANATGTVDETGTQLRLPLTSENCVGCEITDHYEAINKSQAGCKEFVKEVLEEGSLPVTYEQLLG